MARIIDRLLLFLYTLAVMAASCYALAAAFHLIPYRLAEQLVTDLYYDSFTAYSWIAGFAIVLLISIRLLYVSLRKGQEVSTIDQRTEYGDIRISLETVENLSLKAAGRVRGIKDFKAKVRVTNAGLDIVIRTLVDGDSSIPAMTEEIQQAVKSHIEEITGIPVATVSVYVANLATSPVTFKSRVE